MALMQLNLRAISTIAMSGLILVVIYLSLTRSVSTSPLQLSRPHFGKLDSSPSDLLQDVFNQTLGFQKILVINLPSRTDHRDAMSLAAAFTGLEIDYVDGVTNVTNKTLPPGASEVGMSPGGLGAWRAHVNVARLMVEQNIQSALVLEDDADWDIRIKQQMRDFAKASRLLVQPLQGTNDTFLDPTYPQPRPGQKPSSFDISETSSGEPTTSPYGDLDRWDLLWLGHCGCRFPFLSDGNVPLGRAVVSNDNTVPKKDLINVEFGDNQLQSQYPDYTRVVSRARVNTCTLGYALSQQGARRMLYELGLHKMTGTTDMMFRSVCDGVDGRDLMTCLTVQPQLFQHHRAVGPKTKFSDINEDESGEYIDKASTANVRWSTRMNFRKLVNGQTDFTDQYPD
ncbi:Hypothetical protein R9X50_00511600 [Acrodontium crateriforme]|uniref:Glycosyl transferase family 25 domain-containing protein n=1 Tax=Acrodontium crateriforme TaxID=150365 RepID=A0AAQ3M6J6_9PEZI|nr:Hypothetical protein R9X50_00511600 [Acrodontium crateriforme]